MRPILALVLVSGCFVADPINQRPSLDIRRVEPTGEVYRTDTVKLQAVANDPEAQEVYFQWRVYLCDGQPIGDVAAPRPGCDAVPYHSESIDRTTFDVPVTRADVAEPVQQVLVLLEGQDEYGATAKPIQQLVLGISDHPPDVVLRHDPGHGDVVNAPSFFYVKVGDPDDGPVNVQPVDWKVYSPIDQPAYDFVDIQVPQDAMDPGHVQLGKQFVPHGTGDWEVEVTATDPLGVPFSDHIMFTVNPDRDPCLAQWAPIVAVAPSALPMTDPTLFQVTVVDDDLDVFPPIPSDPLRQPIAFHWSILPPGASTRVDLAASGNSVRLDPANYAPGDIVELRVEIADRKGTPLMCADGSATCSTTSSNGCIQRQTWRVEVR